MTLLDMLRKCEEYINHQRGMNLGLITIYNEFRDTTTDSFSYSNGDYFFCTNDHTIY